MWWRRDSTTCTVLGTAGNGSAGDMSRTKYVLNGRDYRRRANALPNLVANKYTCGGSQRTHDLLRHTPELQLFFYDDNFLRRIQCGEWSLLSSFGLMLPRLA